MLSGDNSILRVTTIRSFGFGAPGQCYWWSSPRRGHGYGRTGGITDGGTQERQAAGYGSGQSGHEPTDSPQVEGSRRVAERVPQAAHLAYARRPLRAALGGHPGLPGARSGQAKAVFEWLQGERPGQYGDGQLRTLQRRFWRWRLESGPERELFFEQEWQPGQQCQSDFTHMSSLGETILGEAFPHLVYHFVLPYSRWEHVELAASESFEALAERLQESVRALGGVPREHRTDNLSAATHELRKTGGRDFNRTYLEFLEYYRMTASRNHPGAANQNGSVESAHGHFKRAVEQRLLLAGTRDFGSRERYVGMLREIVAVRNGRRGGRLERERAALRALPRRTLPAYREQARTVSAGGGRCAWWLCSQNYC